MREWLMGLLSGRTGELMQQIAELEVDMQEKEDRLNSRIDVVNDFTDRVNDALIKVGGRLRVVEISFANHKEDHVELVAAIHSVRGDLEALKKHFEVDIDRGPVVVEKKVV